MALLHVLRTGRDLLEHPEEGLNATLATVAAESSVEAPLFRHISALKSPLPERIPEFPAFFQVPVPGSRPDLKQQQKRRPLWRLEWHALWRWPGQDYEVVAVSIEAMIQVLERFECRGTVEQIQDTSLDVTGFQQRRQQWTVVQLAFGVREREELE